MEDGCNGFLRKRVFVIKDHSRRQGIEKLLLKISRYTQTKARKSGEMRVKRKRRNLRKKQQSTESCNTQSFALRIGWHRRIKEGVGGKGMPSMDRASTRRASIAAAIPRRACFVFQSTDAASLHSYTDSR